MNDFKPVHLAILEFLSVSPRVNWYPIAGSLAHYYADGGVDLPGELRYLEKEGLIARIKSAVGSTYDLYELTPRGASIVQQQKS